LPGCGCNIVGLLNINYQGIISASINGGTSIEVADDGTVLIGATINNLSLSAYPFPPGGDFYLGVTCPSSAQASINWLQKYDCFENKTHFIPKAGGKASITGSNIDGVTLGCDPDIVSSAFDANASGGPTSPYITNYRRDGFNLRFSGTPIPINSGSPQPYNIELGDAGILKCYLQSFSLSVSPPQPAVVNYSFVFTNN